MELSTRAISVSSSIEIGSVEEPRRISLNKKHPAEMAQGNWRRSLTDHVVS
jgi:hypothetical protein